MPGEHTADPLPDEVVQRIARLARLALSSGAAAGHADALRSVLAHFRQIQALDLGAVEPMSHPADADAPTDPDTPRAPLHAEVLMRLAPDAAPPYIRVPRVFADQQG